MRLIKLLVLAITLCGSATAFSATRLESLRQEGARDGKQFAEDSRKNGITVDRVVCVVGMSGEDESRPELTQQEIETYARAFGNACMGRNVF
ncbi:hypothetical protein [Pseudomonas sp.]|uniref:hypothetical protein n=1 Tax=Pseudomonas sp. TaxID=306 RepID=UPI003D6DBBFB